MYVLVSLGGSYARALGLLKGFNKKNWSNLVVLHYGY